MEKIDEIFVEFNKQLDKHGYGFQYSVLKKAKDLVNERRSDWIFEVSEFPVEVNGKPTRIDFVLKYKNTRLFIVGECKRADPKFSNWCFIKAPYVRRNRSQEFCIVDHIKYISPFSGCMANQDKLSIPPIDKFAYHIGLVVKSKNIKGESSKSERDAIENTASQVSLAANGLIELVNKKPSLIKDYPGDDLIVSGLTVVPVIFTTAKLWVCNHDISLANIQDGKIDLSKDNFSERNWLFYQYNISPGLKHCVVTGQEATRFSEVLDYEYVRTIPIVSPEGIEHFFQHFCPDDY